MHEKIQIRDQSSCNCGYSNSCHCNSCISWVSCAFCEDELIDNLYCFVYFNTNNDIYSYKFCPDPDNVKFFIDCIASSYKLVIFLYDCLNGIKYCRDNKQFFASNSILSYL